jgi:NAD(P)-dependent dehydrogenase (short-subunit alcohol dehydrogenase family)
MTSSVLVTGGTGRLGRSVVARLVEDGHDVRVLARNERGTEPPVRFFTGDLRRGEGIDAAVDGAAVIINCATSTRGDAEVTANLVAAAAKAGYCPENSRKLARAGCVVRLAGRAERAIGDRRQPPPVRLEPVGQPGSFVHRSQPLSWSVT